MPAAALIESLHNLRRKVKLFAVAFGVGLMVAAAIGLLLATLLLDYELGLDPLARAVLILSALAVLGYAIWQWVARPAMADVTLGHVAGSIEHAFPQFDDRLRSTVDFARGNIPGSPTMQGRVIQQATEMAAKVDLGQIVLSRPVWYSGAGAGAAVLLLMVLGVVAQRHGVLGIALNRLALGREPWPRTVEIEMQSDVPRRIAAGQRLDLKMRLARGDSQSRHATIIYRYDNGPWQQELMSRDKDGAYTASIDARLDQSKTNANLQVKIEAGDDYRDLTVGVVPRLDLARVEAAISPPPYVRPRQPATVNLGDRPAVLAVGSDVALRVSFNKPLDPSVPVELRVSKDPGGKDIGRLPALTWDRPAPEIAVARFQASDSFRFSVRATDVDSFQNLGGDDYELIVREDQPPTVQIEEPRHTEDFVANAQFPIKAVAEDDYGIEAAQIVVRKFGDKNASAKNTWAIDLVQQSQAQALGATWTAADSTAERKRFRLEYQWDLGKLAEANLKPGDVLEYFVQVKDNYDLNGKQHDWVASAKLRVNIISREQLEQQINNAFQQFQKVLDAARKDEVRTKTDTESLQQGVSRRKKFEEPDKAQAERLANQQSNAASQTEQVADNLSQLHQRMDQNKLPDGGVKQTAAEVEKQLRQIADGPMREAGQALNETKDKPADPKATSDQQAKDSQQRSQKLAGAVQNQQRASEQLQQAMAKLGDFSDLPGMIEKMERIKDAQEKLDKQFKENFKGELGKKPEEMSRERQDQSKKMADDQKGLADQLQKALADMEKRAGQLDKTDPAASGAMQQAARIGQQQGLAGKQQQAAQAMQQNQQGQAQKNQNEVELGIEMILNKLREAELRKLEELRRQLADVQKLLAELLQRQSGHNMDNLLLQGGLDRLKQLKAEDTAQLWELSGRDPKNPAPAPAGAQLTVSQEQTERNARDIAKTAEALPDPAPAAKLNAAAGLMERAIVYLRGGNLPDAYAPPQVEALRALVDAKQAIDKAVADIQKQIDERNKGTIREAFVKLLGDQKKLDAKTREIDQTPKGENGDLPRASALELGTLPGQQGALAEAAGEIGKKLASLGSIVYNWANHDIIRSMNEVKDDLGKPETGMPTQAEQHRIEEQVQSMITELERKPPDKPFADRPGGGGGGGNGKRTPKMPTDAELRLLKDLQLAVNRSTKVIDSEKVKDARKLSALGGRQGEMRDVFDQLLQGASGGQMKLDAEPDNKDQLPEEAAKEDVDNQEFDKGLLNDDLTADTVDKNVKLTGDRMGRVRQRLALNNDPGKVTQEIEKRITVAFDELIKLAEQQSSAQSKPGSGKPGEQMGPPKPASQGQQQVAQGQPQAKRAAQAASDSDLHRGAPPAIDTTKELREKFAEWGSLTPRERQAVQESATDKPLGKYKSIIDDYYRSLAQEASKR